MTDLEKRIAFTQRALNDLMEDLRNVEVYEDSTEMELEDILSEIEYSSDEVKAGIRAVIANFEILIREADKDE